MQCFALVRHLRGSRTLKCHEPLAICPSLFRYPLPLLVKRAAQCHQFTLGADLQLLGRGEILFPSGKTLGDLVELAGDLSLLGAGALGDFQHLAPATLVRRGLGLDRSAPLVQIDDRLADGSH